MKINDISSVNSSNLQPEEQFFTLDNQGMIFDILRNKMYSDPIAAICREISCNARDAHREVGKADLPIQIYLPNRAEPFLKIKDFGPGISPERMSNVFIKYTGSTKRNDNIQTGGFGLGAKTPFSYSDSFNIITNYNGKQYNYICFIDETKIGKISLLSEENTCEPNGTEIIVPVKVEDITLFYSAVERSTRYWEVKPTVKDIHGSFVWKHLDIVYNGNDSKISRSIDWNQNFKAIIDGVEYPIQSSVIKDICSKNTNINIISNFRGDTLLYFGVGELSLSANREQIYFDFNTKQKISSRIESLFKEIEALVQDKINVCADLWQANLEYKKFYKEIFKDLDFGPELKWNNFPISKYSRIDISDGLVYSFSKVSKSYYGSVSNKIKRGINRNLIFLENSGIIINDLEIADVTHKHIKKYFDQHPTHNSVQIVSAGSKTNINQLIANHHLNMMNPVLLSSLTKVSNRKYTASSSRLIIYKYDAVNRTFKQVPSSSVDSDTNKKIICSLIKDHNKTYNLYLDNKYISNDVLITLLNNYPEYSIYGVDSAIPESKVNNVFGDDLSFHEFLEEILDQHQDLDYVKLAYAFSIKKLRCKLLNNSYDYKLMQLLPDTSLFKQALFVKESLKDFRTEKSILLKIYELFNGEISDEAISSYADSNPEINLFMFSKQLQERYQLLMVIDDYQWDSKIKEISQYINLIDASLTNKES